MEFANEIRRKLTELASLDPDLHEWGAEKHGYRLNATATREQVERYEKKHRIRLPEPYVIFLLNVGNGGAGPGMGLYTFDESFSRFEEKCRWHESRNHAAPRLDLRFPTNSQLARALRSIQIERPIDWRELAKMPKISFHGPDDGVLEIADHSCCREYLVITGEQRGKVWNQGDSGEWLPDRKDDDFLDWYLTWLNGQISCLTEKKQ